MEDNLKEKDNWFYIEPFVHIDTKNRHLLLFNTLNGEAIEYINEPEIETLIKKIEYPKNNRVVKLTKKELQNPTIKKFVDEVRMSFSGDLLDKSWSDGKPIQISPILNLQTDADFFVKKESQWIGEEMMNNLYEITFYINNFSNNYSSLLECAHKQFLFPSNQKTRKEIAPKSIYKILEESIGSPLSVVNIIGGNIFLHSHISVLIDYFNKQRKKIIYHICSSDFVEHYRKSSLFNNQNSSFVIYFNPDFYNGEFIRTIEILKQINYNSKIVFIVENKNNLDKINLAVSSTGLKNYFLQPYYNSKNIDLFTEYVFMTKESIFESKPKHKEIFQRMKINTNYFGKLTILADGSVYANLNEKELGTVSNNSLYDLIYKEMYYGKSWRKTRKKVEPCKNCIFEFLCPPISGYEYVIGKNNLCNIK